MEAKDKEKDDLWSDDDKGVYIPNELMRTIDRANFKLGQAQQELQKFGEEIKRDSVSNRMMTLCKHFIISCFSALIIRLEILSKRLWLKIFKYSKN